MPETPSLVALRQEYAALHQIASEFGFTDDAALVAHRAALIDQPLLVLVQGTPGSGKSTLIDLLAGQPIVPAETPPGCLHLFRAATSRRDTAELHHAEAGVPDEVLPADQARLRCRAAGAPALRRVTWSLHAPELPEHVMLGEGPTTADGRVDREACWLADAMVWTMRADRLGEPDEWAALDNLNDKRNPGTPVLIIVTHMDRVPAPEWPLFLQSVRDRVGSQAERVIPFAFQRDARGLPIDGGVTPARVEIRSRFFRGARVARQRSHTQFVEALRAAIARRFEDYVDRVLEDRWTYLRFRQSIGTLLGVRMAAVADGANGSYAAPEALRDAVVRDLATAVGPMLSGFRAPLPAGVPITEWLDEVRQAAEAFLLERAARPFAERHGVPPDDAPAALEALERLYLRLHDRPLGMPAPYAFGGGISPVLFLARLQEAAFIEQWNRAYLHQLLSELLPRLQRKLSEGLDQLRETLLNEWERCKEPLSRSVRIVWNARPQKRATENATHWSVAWATTLLRPGLQKPASYLAQQRLAVPLPEGRSLFVSDDIGAFLRPFASEGQPGERLGLHLTLARMIQTALLEETERRWQEDRTVRISTSLRRNVRRRLAVSIGSLVALCAGWIYLFGTGPRSVMLLPVLLVAHSGASWLLIDRFISRSVGQAPDQQTSRLHQMVRGVFVERIDQLKRFLDEHVRKASLSPDLIHALMDGQAEPQARYLPYGELIRRLRNPAG